MRPILMFWFCLVFFLVYTGTGFGQTLSENVTSGVLVEEGKAATGEEEKLVSLDFKEADIRNVLRLIAYSGGVNIVPSKEVVGTVSVSLTEVPWEQALAAILKAHDYGYEREGDIIIVTTLEKLREQKEAQKKIEEVEPLFTEVFDLKYVDASDVKKVADTQLSERGVISTFTKSSRRGWEFATMEEGFVLEKVEQGTETKSEGKSMVMVVTDIKSVIKRIRELVNKLDRLPAQVLIEAKIMEVRADDLRDIGIEWRSMGEEGAENEEAFLIGGGDDEIEFDFDTYTSVERAADPLGINLIFDLLGKEEVQMVFTALDDLEHTDVLSNPRIVTLDNQEATILVGDKYPILETEISTETGRVVSESLDRYEPVGIILRVIPQIWEGDRINMVIHPVVSSLGDDVIGTTGLAYKIFNTREADTQVTIRDQDTVVIGGLYSDRVQEDEIKVPVLGDIPLLGTLFRRQKTGTEKIDLVIFITASIVGEGELPEKDRMKFEQMRYPSAMEEEFDRRGLIRNYYKLGMFYYKQGRYKEAQEEFGNILKLAPGDKKVKKYFERAKSRLKNENNNSPWGGT